MTRTLIVAGAQMGPVARNARRSDTVVRLMEMMREAAARGARLVVFPELALTTFFPRWRMEDQDEIDGFFEREMPGPATQPLFDLTREIGLGFYLGYAELDPSEGKKRYFNSAVLVDERGRIVGKYRKIHLPGHADNRKQFPVQHLEKKYFEVGDLGFKVWDAFDGKVGMGICNDRRWPEAYRVMALQGAELLVPGYNTPTHIPWTPVYDHLTYFHHELCVTAGAYQNSMWVAAVARGGHEEGAHLMSGSIIVSPSGEIVARAATTEDEVIFAKCDLGLSRHNREEMFNFAKHRRPEHYGLITRPLAPDE